MGDEFNDIPIEGYTKEQLGLILSNVHDSAVQFAVDWVDNGWFESEAHVGPLSERANVIEAVAGFPTATRSNTNIRKQSCWRLASFINEALRIVGKNWDDINWLGHPAVPGQLLVVVQAAMELSGVDGWVRPNSVLPIVKVIAQIRSIGARTDKVLDLVDESASAAEESLRKVWADLRAAKREARSFDLGEWDIICEMAGFRDINDTIKDAEDAVEKLLRMCQGPEDVHQELARSAA